MFKLPFKNLRSTARFRTPAPFAFIVNLIFLEHIFQKLVERLRLSPDLQVAQFTATFQV